MFMAVAVMMWWPVVNPVAELERIPGMLIFWVGITAVFFRWTKDEYMGWRDGA